MQQMGFSEWPEGLVLTASFHALHVYEAQGFAVKDANVTPFDGVACGIPYRACIGSKINAISQALLQDGFCKSEEEWQKEKSTTPPYLVIHFGPVGPFSVSKGFIMRSENEITTYSVFRDARFSLMSMADKSLASISTAVSLAFRGLEHDVRYLYKDRYMFGLTEDGCTVHDICLSSSTSCYGSSWLVRDEVENRLSSGLELARNIHEKYSKFMRLAADESDNLKKFLYYFLAIERIVHSVFSGSVNKINFEAGMSLPMHSPLAATDFLKVQDKGFKNLKDRFIWCLIFEWPHLADEDLYAFSSAKKVRDEIAHGALSDPPADIVVVSERLALKLLSIQ